MLNAIEGMLATSDWETGMIPLASMETLRFMGQRLCHVSIMWVQWPASSPVYLRVTRVEGEVESRLAVGKDTDEH